jgi:hypothetical protein
MVSFIKYFATKKEIKAPQVAPIRANIDPKIGPYTIPATIVRIDPGSINTLAKMYMIIYTRYPIVP